MTFTTTGGVDVYSQEGGLRQQSTGTAQEVLTAIPCFACAEEIPANITTIVVFDDVATVVY
jgi:hypothetical protein